MANIAANNYKEKKILKRHKNFMPDGPSLRRPNNTRRIEFHAGQCPMYNTYFKPCKIDSKNYTHVRKVGHTSEFLFGIY